MDLEYPRVNRGVVPFLAVFSNPDDAEGIVHQSELSVHERVTDLVEFAAWCCTSLGNKVGTFTYKCRQ